MKNLAVLLFSMFSVFAFSQNVNAEQWPLSVDYSNTNNLGLTEIRGVSEMDAAISAKDADGQLLLCLPFLALVEGGEFTCFGLNIVAPVTITAGNKLFGSSDKDPATVTTEDVNANSTPWDLSAGLVSSFFGIASVKGLSEQGAEISAVDSTDKKLFCTPLLGLVGENGEFTCFGFGITPPLTITAKTSIFSILQGRADSVVIAGISSES